MNSNTDIARQLAAKYGIVDEGEIVELMDLEAREELVPDASAKNDEEES